MGKVGRMKHRSAIVYRCSVCVFLLVAVGVEQVACYRDRLEVDEEAEYEEEHMAPHTLYSITPGRVTDEERLLRTLMKNYDAASRPVYNASDTATVDFGMSLVQLQKMDEVNQELNIYVWLEHEWTDYRLRWDPADYNNLHVFRIPVSLLWVPDVVLYNNADDMTGTPQTRAMLSHDGKIFYGPPVRLRSTCRVDISYYPFDLQRCSMKFGSWTYGGFQLDMHNRSSKIDQGQYVPSGEWELIETTAVRNVIFYPCCPDEPYPDVTFHIAIKRRPMFYWVNIILPCIWFQLLNVIAFYLPTDSGERVTLIVTVLLSYSVFMLLLAEKVPATSDYVPLLGLYLSVAMSLNAISLVFCVMALNLHFGSPFNNQPPPTILKRLFLHYIPRFLRINTSANWDILQAAVKVGADGLPRSGGTFCWRRKRQRSVSKQLELLERGSDSESQHQHLHPHSHQLLQQQRLPNGDGRLQRLVVRRGDEVELVHQSDPEVPIVSHSHLSSVQVADQNGNGNGSNQENPIGIGFGHAETGQMQIFESPTPTGGSDVWQRRMSKHEQQVRHVSLKPTSAIEEPALKCTCVKPIDESTRKSSYTRYPPSYKRRKSSDVAQILIKQSEDEAQTIIKEWRMIAYVLDRCFFYIFMVVSFMATLIILVFIPYLNPQK